MQRVARDVAAAIAGLSVSTAAAATPTAAQEWRLGTQFGRLSYPGASAATLEQSSVAMTLVRAGFDSWFALSAATPLQGDAQWASAAAARRLTIGGRIGAGLDMNAHGFAQRITMPAPPATPLPPLGEPRTITSMIRGGGAQAMLLGYARAGSTRLEVRGGAAGHALGGAGIDETDWLAVADASLLLRLGPVQAGPEAQHWNGRATYVGGTARVSGGPLDAWASAGQWTHGGPTAVAWSAGAGLTLPYRLRIDGSLRRNTFDPLYRTTTASSASVGVSVRIAGSRSHQPPVPASYVNGRAVIRLAARDARGTPRIAGDFTGWEPVPMVAGRDGWTVSVPVEPGVYHYAFVNEAGEWFVPASTPGRRDDGMGGHVAVLVVER